MLLWMIEIVVAIGVIVAIIQIRNATQRMASRLDDIYAILKEQNTPSKQD
ncbi:hypothetical protein [Alicyclobacillus fodiniaquatilis]|uniref:Uncharacterized protein n=1 Tax=Alicyclobacillus fodiniaquatilis TaxID=1661150 RepID=A0ABW4JPD7_9BACL